MNIDNLIESLEQQLDELQQSPDRAEQLPISQQIDHLQINFARLHDNCPFVGGDLVIQNPYNTVYKHPKIGQPAIVAETYTSTHFEPIAENALFPYNMIVGLIMTDGNIIYYKVHSSYFIPFKQEQSE